MLPSAREVQHPSRKTHATIAPRVVPPGGRHAAGQLREPLAAGDERHRTEMLAGDEEAAGAEAEEHDEEQRQAEARGARRGRRDRERQEGDRVDEAERDDRKGDRLEPELDAAHPAQRADLDQVVEPEGKDRAARRGGTAGGEAAGAIRAGRGGEELLPAERAEDVAREVEGDRAADETHVARWSGQLVWVNRLPSSTARRT